MALIDEPSIRKYNNEGSIQWTYIDNSIILIFFDSDIDINNNIYAVGRSNSLGTGRIRKIDFDGNLEWGKDISNATFTGVAVDTQDEIIVVGKHVLSGSKFLRVIKYDSNGNELWNNNYGIDAPRADSMKVAIDLNDNIYIIDDDGSDRYLRKIDSDGNEITTGNWPIIDATDINIGDNIIIDKNNKIYTRLETLKLLRIDTSGTIEQTYTFLNNGSLGIDWMNNVLVRFSSLNIGTYNYSTRKVASIGSILPTGHIACPPGKTAVFRR